MNITDEMVQAAARVIAAEHASDAYSADPSSGEYAPLEREQYEAEAQAVIEVVAPLIAAQALRDVSELIYAQAARLHGEKLRSGQFGIEYLNGMEDAAMLAAARGDIP